MSELHFRHQERKDCLFGSPRCDQKWYCRQKLCTKSGGGKNNKKSQLFHQLNISAASLSPSPPLPLHTSRGKQKKKTEQRSNFKCNSAATPINLNFTPQTHNCVHPAGRGGLCGCITWKFKMLCWLCTIWSFCSVGLWCAAALGDLYQMLFLGWPFSFQANTVQLRLSGSQKLLYERFKRLKIGWRESGE